MPVTRAQLSAMMKSGASGGLAGGIVGRGAPPAGPSNIPTMSVAGSATAGDTVPVTATTDDGDGFVTTSTVLLDNGASLGAMTGSPPSWSKSLVGITAGSHSLVARRVTASGSVDSVPHVVTVSAGGGAETLDVVNVNLANDVIQTESDGTVIVGA